MTMQIRSLVKYLSLLASRGTPLPVACKRNSYSVLFFGVFPSDLCFAGIGKIGTYYNAATIECAHRRACKLLTDYKQKILTFPSIYVYFAILKAFNTNTFNFHLYFKGILSSQPSHMHNTMQTQNK